MLLYSVLLLTVRAGLTNGDEITPDRTEVSDVEGSNLTLSCNYSSSVSVYILWYRQHPNLAPQYLLTTYTVDNKFLISDADPRLSARMTKEKGYLHLSSAELSDSALYYCALQPTGRTYIILGCLRKSVGNSITPESLVYSSVEGNDLKLSCRYKVSVRSLHWYRQFSNSVPQFLILEYEGFVNNATPPVPGISIKHEKTEKLVSLHLSSAKMTDSALYYCALEPTMSNDFPRYMVKVFPSGTEYDDHVNKRRFHAELNDSSVSLTIQDLQVSDSAVYYCALRPTVTAAHSTLIQKR
ncbi:uncharacterized protein LOC134099327 [Sardina pilchardus]|uniref:uncharacterized protein LOC134099327 n=1 Tax=Sardina pilchardus TaxID=27697 RepID=UPI002E1530CD